MTKETGLGWAGHLQINYENLGCIGVFNELSNIFSRDLANPDGEPWFLLADPHVYAYNSDELWLCVTQKTKDMIEEGFISPEDIALTEYDNWAAIANADNQNEPVNMIFGAKWCRSERLLEFDSELFDEIIRYWSDKHFERAQKEPKTLEEKIAFWLSNKSWPFDPMEILL